MKTSGIPAIYVYDKQTGTKHLLACDIDVMFENGEIAYHKRYVNFKKGNIRCPLIYEAADSFVKVINPNLTPVLSFTIDLDDIDMVKPHYWSRTGGGYVAATIKGSVILIHRFIMDAPDGLVVDHINGKTTGNRKSNLRICTNSDNFKNRAMHINNTSGYKGVSWKKSMKKWTAQIMVNRSKKSLGYFSSKEDAARAYDEAAVRFHGEFARTNIWDH